MNILLHLQFTISTLKDYVSPSLGHIHKISQIKSADLGSALPGPKKKKSIIS
uniref:Uncharacterized protein n=1 Tax=Anguilla anguilla TaxID=7936 RepID=A0A0E9RQV4_ANGAN